MRARLIVTTIVVGGFALAIGAIALAGKPTAPGHVEVPRTSGPSSRITSTSSTSSRTSTSASRTASPTRAAGRGPCVLRTQLGTDADDHGRDPGDPLERARSSSAGRSRSRTTRATRSSPSRPSRPSSSTRRTTTGTRPTSRGSRCGKGSPSGHRRRRKLDQGRLLPPRSLQPHGQRPHERKAFWDCYTSYQGISVGWVDQYHQATDGQQVDLTGLPNATDYYLVSTTNPTGAFLEQDKTNNTAWVKLTLSTDSSGNRKVTVTDHSPCESPGMCGEVSPNR